MDKENIEFRKKCQSYESKITILLKKGNRKEARKLINSIEESLKEWEDFMKSARFKINILKSLLIKSIIEEKRFIK